MTRNGQERPFPILALSHQSGGYTAKSNQISQIQLHISIIANVFCCSSCFNALLCQYTESAVRTTSIKRTTSRPLVRLAIVIRHVHYGHDRQSSMFAHARTPTYKTAKTSSLSAMQRTRSTSHPPVIFGNMPITPSRPGAQASGPENVEQCSTSSVQEEKHYRGRGKRAAPSEFVLFVAHFCLRAPGGEKSHVGYMGPARV